MKDIDLETKQKEQDLLKKLYESQDLMEILLDKGKDDFHYLMIGSLIRRLEKHLQDSSDLL